jgi:hypothetical protein
MRGISNYDYEIGNIYLHEKYRSKINKQLNEKFSFICFSIVLSKINEIYKIKNLFLFLSFRNSNAFYFYKKFDFIEIETSIKFQNWVIENFHENDKKIGMIKTEF